jgi:23S rRNA (pseudouridine1915-N3)-methyltransferase
MREIHLLVVGKLSDSKIEFLEQDYRKRILSPKFFVHELKSHSENLDLEGREILLKIAEINKSETSPVVLLTEKGEERDSKDFSDWLFNKLGSTKVIFVIGGASGFGNDVLKIKHQKVSLSKMTFPHKIARLLFIEQIYRAITIKENHPYHK